MYAVLYIRKIFLIQMKYRLQNMNNHMVGRAGSIPAPLFSILLKQNLKELLSKYAQCSNFLYTQREK